jgi:hypothetical protein
VLINIDYSKDLHDLNTVKSALRECVFLKILRHQEDFVNMIIETDEAYYYAEKNYKNKIVESTLNIKIFKQQKNRVIHLHYVYYKALYFLVDRISIDFKKFMISLRKDRIRFHKWFEKDGVINTSTY